MKKYIGILVLVGLLTFVIVGTALAANPNPRVIPNKGSKYEYLSTKWWQWAYSFPAAEVPFFNTGGAVDISAGQSLEVWFLAGQDFSQTVPVARTGVLPAGKPLFFPIANLVNDYPCPPEYGVEPPPGETLEHYLQRTGNEYLDYYITDPDTQLFAEIDGTALTNLSVYKATSPLFTFTADPALAGYYDPCITGTPQVGVAVGYWLLLPPLNPGVHTLHYGATTYGQDVTYTLTVRPGK